MLRKNRLILLCAAMMMAFCGAAGAQGTLYQTNLLSFLRADIPASITQTAGRVSTWTDQSGNSNNATQTTAGSRPTYVSGAEPYVSFETNQNNFMSIAGSISSTQAFSFFLVADFISPRGSGGAQVFLSALDGASSAHYVLWNTIAAALNTDTGTGAAVGPRILPGRHAIGVTSNATNTIVYIDDAIYTLSAQANKAFSSWTIGNGQNTYYGAMNCYLYADYNATLTAAQAAGNMQYLLTRYKIPLGKPRVKVVVDGDSISAAWGSSNNQGYVAQLNLPSDWQIVNYGYPGLRVGATSSPANPSANYNYSADIAPLYDSSLEYNVLVVYLGTNTMAAGTENVDAATATTELQYYLTTAKATGWNKIIVLTCLPRNDLDDTRRTTFNTNVRAMVGVYCDAVADIAGDSRFVTAAYNDPRYFYYDGVHPSSLACGIMAPIARKTIFGVVPVSLGGYYVAPSVTVKGGF